MFWRRTLAALSGAEIPAHLRADFTLLTAQHMRSQARLMFAGFILSLPIVVYGSSPDAGPIVTYGLPLLVFLLSATGLILLHKPLDKQTPETGARRTIGIVWKLCVLTAAVGSVWCIASWASAPPATKIYYPAIMSLGALTLGFCLTAVRGVGLSVLLVTLGPIGFALASTGETMDIALALGMTIAIAFQVFIMTNHQRLLLRLVEERHKSAQQARRDPLTGLANRRALMELFKAEAAQGRHVRLMVVDIDRFKAINDRHGHDVGDEVLRAFAQLLGIHARGDICAARLGGEEFALFGRVEALDPAIALQLLGEIRGAYMPHGGSITASIGVADAVVNGKDDWNGLYGQADRALYRAKNDGRNRVESCDMSVEPTPKLAEQHIAKRA